MCPIGEGREQREERKEMRWEKREEREERRVESGSHVPRRRHVNT